MSSFALNELKLANLKMTVEKETWFSSLIPLLGSVLCDTRESARTHISAPP